MSVPVSAGYWALDLKSGELILCARSRAMFGIDGRDTRKLAKGEWRARIHLDDVPAIDRELRDATYGDGVYTAQFRAVHPDGRIRRIVGVGRRTPREHTRFVGLNFDVAQSIATAIQASSRPLQATTTVATHPSDHAEVANENQRSGTPARAGSDNRHNVRAAVASERQLLRRRAEATIERRRLREKFLSPAMLGEPAFEMLLALYVSENWPNIVPLPSLSALVGVGKSAAERWLNVLVNEGLASKFEGRVTEPALVYVSLTERGRLTLGRYFRACEKA